MLKSFTRRSKDKEMKAKWFGGALTQRDTL